jgi:hypothetical protein
LKLHTGPQDLDPLDPDDDDEDHKAAGGAPPPLLLSMAWIRSTPSADGKSPVAGSKEPTPWPHIFTARPHITSTLFVFKIQRSRHADAGEGGPNSTDPETLKLEDVESSTTAPRREPSPEGKSSATKTLHRPHHRLLSAADQQPRHPTLCTSRESSIPHPPAAVAAAGGGEIERFDGERGGFPGGFRKSPIPYCSGRIGTTKLRLDG